MVLPSQQHLRRCSVTISAFENYFFATTQVSAFYFHDFEKQDAV
jgi:hypothetical protein